MGLEAAGRARMRYDAGAPAYDRLVGRWSALYATATLQAAGVKASDRVLDLATGTGDAAILATVHAGSYGTVVGVDLSLPMLLGAKRKSSEARLSFVAADAQGLPFRDRSFDAVICLFGLMFFPDRIVALRGARSLLRAGGRIALSVWGPSHNAPFAGIVAEALAKELPADRDELLRPFALADPRVVEDLLAKAGFSGVRTKREVRQARFVSVEDFWEPIEAGGGRLGQAYLGLPRDARARVARDVWEAVGPFSAQGQILMDLEAYIATGTA
jgi:ubiquinone/menaquinone biosynthesis C-methylase UbiE